MRPTLSVLPGVELIRVFHVFNARMAESILSLIHISDERDVIDRPGSENILAEKSSGISRCLGSASFSGFCSMGVDLSGM